MTEGELSSSTTGWITMTFGMHTAIRIHFNNFDDNLAFHLTPSSGQSFKLTSTLVSNLIRVQSHGAASMTVRS